MSLKSLVYPVVLVPDEELGGFAAQVYDVPEAIAQGDTREEALQEAFLAFEDVLASNYIEHEDPRAVPLPTKAEDITLEDIAMDGIELRGVVRDYLGVIELPEALSKKICAYNETCKALE